MIYLLHVEQVLREVLQREFTWLREMSYFTCEIQPKYEISTPPRVTLRNFTTSIRCIVLCHHKCSTTDATMKFGKGRSWKECFEILACCHALCSYTTKVCHGVYPTPWGFRMRRRKCAPGNATMVSKNKSSWGLSPLIEQEYLSSLCCYVIIPTTL